MRHKSILLVEDNADDEVLTLRALRKHNIADDVVVVRDGTEERDIFESYNLGANSYVRKPADFAEFSEAVRQLGVYWLGRNEPSPR